MGQAGRYRILRKIADGGMAEIFLATQRGAEGFERKCVLKRILAALVADPQFRNMMIDEAHVAMSLHHSNIVQVLDLRQARGRYFLVLEFVDGWDLNQIINRMNAASFALPPQLALYIAAETCRALSYAHSQTRDGRPLGIVHRDISPHNVLVSQQGEVKLTDFGIAKALGRRERTGAGVIKGKLAFMSPEQASGAVLDARSDLFSVGTMLYVMSTGRRPFEAPTDLEGILRVRQCDFPPPEKIKSDISPKLSAVILRAMRLAPADRYQSAEEMLVDIESVQRTVFQAAGQTELKRWLADLQERDGVPTIGKAAAVPAGDDSEVLEGEDLVFDDETQVDQTLGSGSMPMPTVPLPPAVVAAPAARPRTPPPLPAGVRRGSRHRLSALLLLATAAGSGYLWLRWRRPKPTPPEEVAAKAPEPPPEPEAVQPETVKPPSRIDARPAVAETPPVEPLPPATPDSAPAQATAPAAPDSGPDPDDDDEETLLKHTEPDAEKKVIGAEDQPPEPPPVPSSSKKGSTAAIPARPSYPVVSVKITTRPEGAVIRLKNRVFGRAPMNLRFRPGIPFELSFVKSGYVTKTRRYVFARRQNQAISVSLQKRSKKSFLRRLFGG
jgi:serine/threonine-protein kinase